MSWPFSSLRPFSADLIVIDPPWLYELRSEAGEEKSPQAQYGCMPTHEIAALQVGHLARGDCLLLCWATWPMFPDALRCIQEWGFTYSTVIVWEKVFASGKPAIGTGYRVRSMCEPVILAYHGRPRHKPFPGLFSGIRREHSRKPEEFYALIDRCAPGLSFRADLFGRQSRPGWNVWGDEATKFDEVAA